MGKISKEQGATVKGTQAPVAMDVMDKVVTLGMLSAILEYLHLGVYIEDPRGIPLAPGDSTANMTGKGIWLGFHSYK